MTSRPLVFVANIILQLSEVQQNTKYYIFFFFIAAAILRVVEVKAFYFFNPSQQCFGFFAKALRHATRLLNQQVIRVDVCFPFFLITAMCLEVCTQQSETYSWVARTRNCTAVHMQTHAQIKCT